MQTNKLVIDNTKSNYTSQSEAMAQLILGNNVFLSGPAGSGKSYIIRKYCKLLRQRKPNTNIFKTSTTGLSAFNISGETIHSYSGQGISPKPYNELKNNHKSMGALWAKSAGKIKMTNVLIIDEISMFSESALTFLLERMKDLLGDRFNKVQVIVAGDFSQLAPVATRQNLQEYGNALGNYCYGTKAWGGFNFVHCYLDRIYRAKDTRLQFILNEITNGRGYTEKVKDILRSIPQQREAIIPGTPTLLPTNKEVLHTNTYWQKKNKNQEYYFPTVYDNTKRKKFAVKMAKEKDVDKEVRLRVNDTVMITANDSSSNNIFSYSTNDGPTLKNGMIGTLKGVNHPNHQNTDKPGKPIELKSDDSLLFDYQDGNKTFHYLISVKHEEFVDKKDNPIAGYHQFPIKLAYAISIHKSQGQTFSKIAVNLNNCWRPGLGYVALSRATNINGITLINDNPVNDPWNYKALQVDRKSELIKKSLLQRAKHTRKLYAKIYPMIADNIDFVLDYRYHGTVPTISKLMRLVKKQQENKNDNIEIK